MLWPLSFFPPVFPVNEAKGKQKVLGSNQKLKFSPTELMVYCKDFRMVRFRFDEAGPDSTKKVRPKVQAEDCVSVCVHNVVELAAF